MTLVPEKHGGPPHGIYFSSSALAAAYSCRSTVSVGYCSSDHFGHPAGLECFCAYRFAPDPPFLEGQRNHGPSLYRCFEWLETGGFANPPLRLAPLHRLGGLACLSVHRVFLLGPQPASQFFAPVIQLSPTLITLEKQHEREKNQHMKLKFEGLLTRLKELEPLFRLIEVVLVIFGTVFVSCQANTLTKIQLKNNREEHQPTFLISQVLEPNAKGEENANCVLYFRNTSGNFYNIDIDIVCFLDLSYADDTYSYSYCTFNLFRFYFARAWTRSEDGALCRIYSEDNWKKLSDTYMEVLNCRGSFIDLRQYVKISYTDIYGERHSNYYLINSVSQTLLDEKDGSAVFQQYEENARVLDIDDLSLNTLLESID